jgi:hypothetical protein
MFVDQNSLPMIAMIGFFGNGIFFLFVIIILGLSTLVWIAIWTPRGFKSRGCRNSKLIRRIALSAFVASVLVMLLYPPQRRIGNWTKDKDDEPNAMYHPSGYDRGYFGFIPRYAPFSYLGTREVPAVRHGYGLRGEIYYLDSYTWHVDWYILLGQIAILGLIAYPYVRAEPRLVQPN